ncbi:MBL fold metallo-hydrolase [Bhargavaea ullalensis]|uniref:MBL fold metallo-hydrolase n=1 Tax=Bhargavaea ullalensis TaxID=1265685 RepID=UPI003393DA4A
MEHNHTMTDRAVHPVIWDTDYGMVGSINFYLLDTGGSLVLIDAGLDSDECRTRLQSELKNIGATVADISRILLTHHHEDHAGLVPWLLEQQNIPVHAHPDAVPRLKADRKFLEMRLEFFRTLYREMGCGDMGAARFETLEETIRDADELALRTEIRPLEEGDSICRLDVIETPGHSPDCISFVDKRNRFVFSGDVILDGASVNALIDPDLDGNRLPSVSQQRQSLKKISGLDTDVLLPGHRNEIRNHRELAAEKIARMDRKDVRILDLIRGGTHVPAEIAQAYYGKKYHAVFPLIMSEIIGHLDFLESEGKISKTMTRGIWHYRAESSD